MQIADIGALPAGRKLPAFPDGRGPPPATFSCSGAGEAGCDVQIDSFGNIFAIRRGREDIPALFVGSHLDAQPHGGRFDGVAGVLAGLEIIRTLNDWHIETRQPLVVVNWTNEEGVRFKPGLTGSAGFASRLGGRIPPPAPVNPEGADYFGELTRIGYAGARSAPDARTQRVCLGSRNTLEVLKRSKRFLTFGFLYGSSS